MRSLLEHGAVLRGSSTESTQEPLDDRASWARFGSAYIDLALPERGVLVASAERPVDMKHVLPRKALRPETWLKVQQAAHPGWHKSGG